MDTGCYICPAIFRGCNPCAADETCVSVTHSCRQCQFAVCVANNLLSGAVVTSIVDGMPLTITTSSLPTGATSPGATTTTAVPSFPPSVTGSGSLSTSTTAITTETGMNRTTVHSTYIVTVSPSSSSIITSQQPITTTSFLPSSTTSLAATSSLLPGTGAAGLGRGLEGAQGLMGGMMAVWGVMWYVFGLRM